MKVVTLKERRYDRNLKRAAVFRAMLRRARQQKEGPSHVNK